MAAPGREVGEERFVRVLAAHTVQPLDGLVGHRIREVVRVVLVVELLGGADDLLVLRQARIPLARAAAEEPVEVVEAPPVGPPVERTSGTLLPVGREVPFPESSRAVTIVPQDPRERRAVPWQRRAVAGEPAGEFADGTESHEMAVPSRQQRGAGG